MPFHGIYLIKKYSRLFKAKTSIVAKHLRIAPGEQILHTKFQYSDRKPVKQTTENPYLQYLIGIPGYQHLKMPLTCYFQSSNVSSLVLFSFVILKMKPPIIRIIAYLVYSINIISISCGRKNIKFFSGLLQRTLLPLVLYYL